MKRPEALDRFLHTARETLSMRMEDGAPSGVVATRIFDALASSVGVLAPKTRVPIPAYRHFSSALERALAAPGISSLAEAFAALEPELRWRRRPGSEAHGKTFHDGHANADIVGPTGLEQRGDVLAGASLVAPGVRYVDHRHPPEEVYIVMSEGEWYREDRGWHTPGVGGIVHNPPDVVHAMRAGPEGLLALWFLWAG